MIQIWFKINYIWLERNIKITCVFHLLNFSKLWIDSSTHPAKPLFFSFYSSFHTIYQRIHYGCVFFTRSLFQCELVCVEAWKFDEILQCWNFDECLMRNFCFSAIPKTAASRDMLLSDTFPKISVISKGRGETQGRT